ncbi:uncharacterized protein LOC113516220 [Galleria mellonella]|uniref:Uncharacterized protein LOC113516220 n=1 Tax=Galleria mellonella TaxID=7137 RepID=A0ABM3N2X2_GALME|nr:uncharacterized protein LOC113516220 [Galleria mellonella]
MTLIEKLVGRENYNTWRFAVQSYLQHEELWNCIEGSEIVDPKLDMKAKTKIILLVDPINYVHIQEAKTAKEVWQNLAKAFDDKGLTRRVGLLKDLITTTLESCQNVEVYVNKVMTTAHKLRNISFDVNDEWLGTLLLAGLPDDYKPMIMALESSGVPISADSVKTKLLQEIKSSESTALYVNKNYGNKGRQKNEKPYKPSKGPRCFNCNRYRHISKNCKSKKKEQNTNRDSGYVAVFSATTKNNNGWYIDSGASMHMTMRRDWIYDEIPPPISNIKIANDKMLPVKSCGKLNLNVIGKDGNKHTIQVKNVLYVPELVSNLLSVSQMINNGCSIQFTKYGCKIFNKENTEVATANLINNMYRLNTDSISAYTCKSNETDFLLWHQRMAHLNFSDLNKLTDCVEGVRINKNKIKMICESCQKGKQPRLSFPAEGSRAKKALELIHSDICGPLEVTSLGGARYFLTFTDDYTRKNGMAERMNRTLIERARCMLINSNLQKQYWAEAVAAAAYITNRCPTRALGYSTPEEKWSGKKPDVRHLKIFGCEAMVHTPKEKHKKLDPKASKMIFIGYCDTTKGYRLIDTKTKKIIISRNVIFMENSIKKNYVMTPLTTAENNDTVSDSLLENTQNDVSTVSISDDSVHSDEGSIYIPEKDISPIQPSNVKTRSQKLKLLQENNSYFCQGEEPEFADVPQTYSEAISSKDGEKWKQSIKEELEAHKKNNTWQLVLKPPGVTTIGCKWVFRLKDEPSGMLYKSRLCAKGCSQKYNIDYTDTFSPTVRYDSVRILLSEVCQHDLEMIQFDVKTAFLYGDISEDIYMTPPKGIDVPSNYKKEKGPEEKLPYREAVGSLMHLAIVSRPDIMFGVSLYKKEKKSVVEGYSDSDYANDIDTRRSTSGYIFMKNGAAVTWATQRQQSIALSTTEAEFMAACSATKEAIWIKRLLLDINEYNQDTICLYIDNQSAISAAALVAPRVAGSRSQPHLSRSKLAHRAARPRVRRAACL